MFSILCSSSSSSESSSSNLAIGYKPAMRNYKTKESDTVERIKEEFKDFDWVVEVNLDDDENIHLGLFYQQPSHSS